MRKALRWRYYCDFCGRGSGSPSHIKRHEAGCTNNPDRVCGMCREAGIGDEQQTMGSLVAALRQDTETLTPLRDLSQNCPACMLAAIRQSGIQCAADEDGPGVSIPFDFQAEKRSFWSDVNDLKAGDLW